MAKGLLCGAGEARPRNALAGSVRRRITAPGALPRRMDWVLVGTAAVLSLLGAVLIDSATRGSGAVQGGDTEHFALWHLFNAGLGVLLLGGVVWCGLARLVWAAPWLYAASVILVVLVFTPLGSTANGAQRWLDLGGFALQPAEFAKVSTVLMLAVVLGHRSGEVDRFGSRRVLLALAVVVVPSVFILLTPDLGQSMGLGAILLCVLFAAGAHWGWVLGLLGAVAMGALLVWQLELLDAYQVDRFAAFVDPALDPAGVGYNTSQARTAIGSGGLTGTGLFNGPQTAGQFVPEQHTDFVFSVAGEELGFLGAGGIIVLFGVLLWRALRIARRSSDLLGALVASGVVAWLAFQTFESIGMNLGIMPVTGLPLVFVSYGGSSMFAGWVAVGLLQCVHVRRSVSA